MLSCLHLFMLLSPLLILILFPSLSFSRLARGYERRDHNFRVKWNLCLFQMRRKQLVVAGFTQYNLIQMALLLAWRLDWWLKGILRCTKLIISIHFPCGQNNLCTPSHLSCCHSSLAPTLAWHKECFPSWCTWERGLHRATTGFCC